MLPDGAPRVDGSGANPDSPPPTDISMANRAAPVTGQAAPSCGRAVDDMTGFEPIVRLYVELDQVGLTGGLDALRVALRHAAVALALPGTPEGWATASSSPAANWLAWAYCSIGEEGKDGQPLLETHAPHDRLSDTIDAAIADLRREEETGGDRLESRLRELPPPVPDDVSLSPSKREALRQSIERACAEDAEFASRWNDVGNQPESLYRPRRPRCRG